VSIWYPAKKKFQFGTQVILSASIRYIPLDCQERRWNG